MKSGIKINVVIIAAIILIVGIIFGMDKFTNIKIEKMASEKFLNSKEQENIEDSDKIKNIINARKAMRKNYKLNTFDLEDDEPIENPPIKPTTLKIVKKDNQEVSLLEGAKFTIKEIINKEDGKTEEAEVIDRDGNEVGTEEDINGEKLRVITTDDKGEIRENLKAGKYKLTEVKAPEGFKLSSNNEDNIYEVEIKSTIVNEEALKKDYSNYFQVRQAQPQYDEYSLYDSEIIPTKDNAYVAIISLDGEMLIKKEQTTNLTEDYIVNAEVVSLKFNAEGKIENIIENEIYMADIEDGYYTTNGDDIKKYDSNNELIWQIPNKYNYYNMLIDKNGETILIAETYENIEFNENETSNGEKIEKTNNGNSDITLIKINDDGKVAWVNSIGSDMYDDIYDTEILENEIAVLTYFGEITVIPASETEVGEINLVSGKYIIRYNLNGKIETVLNVEEQYMYENGTLLEKDGFIKAGWVEEETVIPSGNTVDGKEIQLHENEGTTLIKFDYNGKVKWVRQYAFPCYIFKIDEERNGIEIENDEEILDINISGEYTANGESMDIHLDRYQEKEFEVDENWKIVCEIMTMDSEDDNVIDSCHTKDNGYADIKYDYNGLVIEKYKRAVEPIEHIQLKEITIKNEVEDSFRLVKQNNSKTKFLAGAKFTIKEIIEENGTVQKIDAVDRDGNPVGTIENINGVEQRVVTTDEKGEIKEKLKQGKYEVQEIQAPEGHKLKEGNNTYEFEITVEQEKEYKYKEVWGKILGKYRHDLIPMSLENTTNAKGGELDYLANAITGTNMYALNNGEFIVMVSFEGKLIIPAEDTVKNEEMVIDNGYEYIIKYNINNKVEWISPLYTGSYRDYDIKANEDGSFEYRYENYSNRTFKIPKEYTVSGKDIEIEEDATYDIKYNSEGKIETTKVIIPEESSISIIGGTTSDIGKAKVIRVKSETIINSDETETNEQIVLQEGEYLLYYNNQDKIRWFKPIHKNIYLDTLYMLNDGSVLFSGTKVGYWGSEIIEPEETTNNKEFQLYYGNSYIIKYNKDNGLIDDVTYGPVGCKMDFEDGSYILKGSMHSCTFSEEQTENNEEIKIYEESKYIWDRASYLVKYNSEGKVIWARRCMTSEPFEVTSDGKYIDIDLARFSHREEIVIQGKDTVSGEEIIIPDSNIKGNSVIIIYNDEFKVERYIQNRYLSELEKINDKTYLGFASAYNNDELITESETVDGKEYLLKKGRRYYIKYDEELMVEQVYDLGEYYTELNIKNDGTDGKLISFVNVKETIIPKENTTAGEEIILKENQPVVIKMNSDYKVEWVWETNKVPQQVIKSTDDSYVIESFDSYSERDNPYVYYTRFSNVVDKQEILTKKELIVTNEAIERKITTEVKGEGGTISGWENKDEPFEIVADGENAKKEIKIVAKKGYRIAKIYINDQEIQFEANEDGAVNLEKFVNITEDKHVVVEFEKVEVYDKKDFNMKVEKWIEYVEMNGEIEVPKNNQKNKLAKVEINKDKINETNLKIHYKIEVTNDSELAGKVGKVIDYIPDGLVLENDGENQWKQEGNIATTKALENTEIKPGESKTLDIVMSWKKGDNNFGTKENNVEILEITNEENLGERTKDDNKSQADIIIAIQTGTGKTITIALIIVFSCIAGIYYYRAKK